MKRKHQRTLELIFARPTSANVQWRNTDKGAAASVRKWLQQHGVQP